MSDDAIHTKPDHDAADSFHAAAMAALNDTKPRVIRPTPHLNRIRRQVLNALGRGDNGLSTVSELVDALAVELTQTRRLLELEQRKVEVTPDEAYALLGGVLNKTRRDLDQSRTHAERSERAAESLARIIGFLTGKDIGEHENGNDPWANAMEAGKEALPLRAALEQAEACVAATRQMANDANTALRTQLLAALGRDDDGRTSLSQYVADLVTELDAYTSDLRDAAGVVAAGNAELECVTRERDVARDVNDGLALALAEVLGTLADHGDAGVRSTWISAARINRWRAALNDSEQARVSVPGVDPNDVLRCATNGIGHYPPAVALVNGEPRCAHCITVMTSHRPKRSALAVVETLPAMQEQASTEADHCTAVANALVAAAGTDEIWRTHHGDITGHPMTLARIAVDAYRQAAR